jgi:2-hydroxychromene-2-carboxylate isomerase
MTDGPATTIPTVRVWVDPGCPWAWQTVRWLRELRDRRIVALEWSLFALEVNSSEAGTPFFEAAQRQGESLVALALARREGGGDAFEAYYSALGVLLHDRGETVSPALARRAADEVGMPGLVDRALADPSLAEEVVAEYRRARALDVFGVPTLQLGTATPIYGPILPLAPSGDEAVEWWRHVSWLIVHDEMYELKRWPRDRRPEPLNLPLAGDSLRSEA